MKAMSAGKLPTARLHPTAVRRTVTSDAADAIRARILSGELSEGEPLRQEALAASLGMSRIPVREALRLLEAEGLVVFNPHRGAVVSTASLDEIEELFELRALIESDLFRRAAPKLGREALDRAYAILQAYDVALTDGRISEYGELNWQLHATLYAAAERPFVLGVVEKLHRQAERYTRMQLSLTHGEKRAAREHLELVKAAENADAVAGAQLLREHILEAGRALASFLRAKRSSAAQKSTRRRA